MLDYLEPKRLRRKAAHRSQWGVLYMLEYLEPKRLHWKVIHKGRWEVLYMLDGLEPKRLHRKAAHETGKDALEDRTPCSHYALLAWMAQTRSGTTIWQVRQMAH